MIYFVTALNKFSFLGLIPYLNINSCADKAKTVVCFVLQHVCSLQRINTLPNIISHTICHYSIGVSNFLFQVVMTSYRNYRTVLVKMTSLAKMSEVYVKLIRFFSIDWNVFAEKRFGKFDMP